MSLYARGQGGIVGGEVGAVVVRDLAHVLPFRRSAQKYEQARDFFGVVREVFAGRQRRRQQLHLACAASSSAGTMDAVNCGSLLVTGA